MESSVHRWTAAAAGGALALLLPVPAAAQQEGAGVLRTAMDRYESRLEGVETVSIVQETRLPMGGRTTSETRLVKRSVDGRAVLVPEGEGRGRRSPPTGVYAALPELTDRARLRGRTTVEGREALAVHLADLQGVDLVTRGLSAGGARNFEADSATLFFDSREYLLRGADVHGRMTVAGRDREVTVRARFRDFRETDGFVHPHVTEARVELGEAAERMRAMLRRMEQAADDSARAAMMGRAAAAMAGGEMKAVVRVRRVRVNPPGPSGGD